MYIDGDASRVVEISYLQENRPPNYLGGNSPGNEPTESFWTKHSDKDIVVYETVTLPFLKKVHLEKANSKGFVEVVSENDSITWAIIFNDHFLFNDLCLVIISICLFFGSSCSQICDSYTVSVQNQYFETLYGVKIGNELLGDTLQTGEKSNEKVFEPGNYLFSTETASGLFLKTGISIKGNNRKIDLIVNEQGQLREK